VQLPAQGATFFTWDAVLRCAPNRAWRRWGTDRLVRVVLRVLADFAAAHPGAPRVGIGDLSRPRGGSFGPQFGGLGHASHQNGLDVDVYYPRKDGAERQVDGPAELDRRLAQDLVSRFVAAGAQYVFVGPNTGLVGRRGVVQVLRYHDDHLHVRIRPRGPVPRIPRPLVPPASVLPGAAPATPGAALAMPGVAPVMPAAVASAAGAPTARAARAVRSILVGRSLRGRPIRALALGDPAAQRAALVIGCIHGNECAGAAVVSRLRASLPPPGTQLWLIPTFNPDGRATRTRQNARGVDLNRNFPVGWRAQGAPFSPYYSGRRPLSEPEARAAQRLIDHLRPALTIWYHQRLALIDESGGDMALERRYARLVGLPLRRLGPLPGTATRWQNATFRDASAFVVELPGGRLSGTDAARHAASVLALLTPAG